MKRKQQDQRKRFMVYLPPTLMEKLRQAAKTNYRSINGELRYILERHFAAGEAPADWLMPKASRPTDADDEHANQEEAA